MLFAKHGGMTGKGPEPYPSDVTDEEWAFVLPYLLLCREDSPQRRHDLHGVQRGALCGRDRWAVAFSAARVRSVVGGLSAEAALVEGWLLRTAGGGRAFASARVGWAQGPADGGVHRQPHTASTPESGARAGYDGAKRRKNRRFLSQSTRSATSWP